MHFSDCTCMFNRTINNKSIYKISTNEIKIKGTIYRKIKKNMLILKNSKNLNINIFIYIKMADLLI